MRIVGLGITELMITPENIPFGKVTASYWGARTNENLHAGRRKRDQRGSEGLPRRVATSAREENDSKEVLLSKG